MAPKYLADQMERSLRNFGVEAIDVFYLHNPETQLTEVSAPEFRKRIRDAFANRRLVICARSFKALPRPAKLLVDYLRKAAQ